MIGIFFLVATFFQSFRVQLFFPLLAIAALRFSRIRTLWLAAGLGLTLDLLAADHYLGFRSLIFILVTAILYSYKRLVFEEKCLTFCLYSTLFGALYTSIMALLGTLGPSHFQWSLSFILIDLLLLPSIDSLIGWTLFIAPKPAIRFLKRTLLQWRNHANER